MTFFVESYWFSIHKILPPANKDSLLLPLKLRYILVTFLLCLEPPGLCWIAGLVLILGRRHLGVSHSRGMSQVEVPSNLVSWIFFFFFTFIMKRCWASRQMFFLLPFRFLTVLVLPHFHLQNFSLDLKIQWLQDSEGATCTWF